MAVEELPAKPGDPKRKEASERCEVSVEDLGRTPRGNYEGSGEEVKCAEEFS